MVDIMDNDEEYVQDETVKTTERERHQSRLDQKMKIISESWTGYIDSWSNYYLDYVDNPTYASTVSNNLLGHCSRNITDFCGALGYYIGTDTCDDLTLKFLFKNNLLTEVRRGSISSGTGVEGYNLKTDPTLEEAIKGLSEQNREIIEVLRVKLSLNSNEIQFVSKHLTDLDNCALYSEGAILKGIRDKKLIGSLFRRSQYLDFIKLIRESLERKVLKS